ncbi:uncharacterized protein [Engystomops pustulosus]|uniref:uncharacterized protein isoform X2 n=1 Tax=Engystomops pustulosus TaxID=76066 RepID=UPI003AFB00D4
MCSLFIKGNTSVLEHCSLSDNWPLRSCTINLRYLTQCPGRNDRLCRTCWTSYRKMKILALQTSVEFLDLKISLHNNNLCMDLHRKDTATNSLLHYESFHPQHLKSGIPVGQFIQGLNEELLFNGFYKQR